MQNEPANDNGALAPWLARLFYGGVNDNALGPVR